MRVTNMIQIKHNKLRVSRIAFNWRETIVLWFRGMMTFCPVRQTISPKTQSCTRNKERYWTLQNHNRNFRGLWYTILGAILPNSKGSRERLKKHSRMKLKIPVLVVRTRSFGYRKRLWFPCRSSMHCARSNRGLRVDSAIHLQCNYSLAAQ